jgi:2-iminobutanoate/2-iminopropanoate deaminase
MKKTITSVDAPAAIGPYSQSVQAGNLLFISGQIPINAMTGEIPESIEEQTLLVLKNIATIVQAAGKTMDDIVKTTIFLTSMQNFPIVNTLYASFFTAPFPARSTVEVARLPKNVMIEIESILLLEGGN